MYFCQSKEEYVCVWLNLCYADIISDAKGTAQDFQYVVGRLNATNTYMLLLWPHTLDMAPKRLRLFDSQLRVKF
jgi:hypothetical protein